MRPPTRIPRAPSASRIRLRAILILLLAAPLLFLPSSAGAQETCGVAVAACRQALFVTQDIVAADNACASAVSADPSDGCARFFRAATRVLRVLGEDVDGADALTFTDSLKEMYDQFGIAPFGRSIYDLSLSLPENFDGDIDFPSDSPTGADLQEAFDRLLVPALEDSIADLQTISPTTEVQMLASEFATLSSSVGATFQSSAAEIDLGDIKLFESIFQNWLSNLLLGIAMDLDVDIDSFTPLVDTIQVQTDLIDAHPDLAKLRSGAAAALADANTANRGWVDAYLAASAFIRAETDDQTDDLVTIEPGDLANEADVRTQLAALRSSFDAPTPILNTGTEFIDEAQTLDAIDAKLGTSLSSQGAVLDFGIFYDTAPFDPRSILPPFDESNQVADGSFPDPTFGSILVPEPSSWALGCAALVTTGLAARLRRRSPTTSVR